jgi:hypothetical protein
MCPSCQDLHVNYAIRTPGELATAIRIAQANVADGTLQTVEPTAELPAGTSPQIESVLPDGPWDDSILYLFRCAKCGARFTLSAETYHGRGGTWSPDGGADVD